MNLNRYMILINVKFLEIASSVEVKKNLMFQFQFISRI